MNLLARLSYANVVATLALFIALGGTGYAALSLPRNSVGSRELRSGAVKHAELAGGAVRSDSVLNGSLSLADLSSSARAALTGQVGPLGQRGPQGPKGDAGAHGADAVTLWAIIDDLGRRVGGTATASARSAEGEYVVSFSRSVAGCAYLASLARVVGGIAPDPPPGQVVVAQEADSVLVRTFFTNGNPQDAPFHLLVVC